MIVRVLKWSVATYGLYFFDKFHSNISKKLNVTHRRKEREREHISLCYQACTPTYLYRTHIFLQVCFHVVKQMILRTR